MSDKERRELHARILQSFGYREYECGYSTNVWHSINHRGHCADDCMMEVPEYDTDEIANGLLLEAMPNARITRDKGVWTAEADWRFFHTEAQSADRKRAVTDCYAKWKGLR